jgi:hypothetical protein
MTKTVVKDEMALIAALERRVTALERQIQKQAVAGCVCPASSELSCANIMCPRRGIGGVR